jgi:hypothetical protein
VSAPGGGAPVYIRGVPHALPPGETLLWEGAPDPRAVARHVFRQRLLAGYFALMLAIWLAFALRDGDEALLPGLTLRVLLAGIALLVVELLARAVARTTRYAITDRRLVLRIGMVLPMSINVPFVLVDGVALATFPDGTGQVEVRLQKGARIAYIALWPHCRAFTLTQPVPLLRGLAEPARIGALLAGAVARSAGAVRPVPERPAEAPAHTSVGDAVALA